VEVVDREKTYLLKVSYTYAPEGLTLDEAQSYCVYV
jgi:hypothetical protein